MVDVGRAPRCTSAISSCRRGSRPPRISVWARPSSSIRRSSSRPESWWAWRRQAVEQLLVDLEVLRQREHGAGVVGDVVQVLHQEDLPQVAQQVVDELRVARAALGQALHEQQGGGRVAVDDDVDDLEEQLGGDDAEHVEHLARRDGGLAEERGELFERADGVAKAALGVPRDLEDGGLVDARCCSAAATWLSTRAMSCTRGRRKSKRWQRDRMVAGMLVGLGGGEHEDDVRRRLLEASSAAR